MLFNSVEFIFFFLPLVIFLFWLSTNIASARVGIGILVVSSLFFYGWWNPKYLLLIVISMIFNFNVGKLLHENRSKSLLIFGLIFNLGLLAYFKYTGFILTNVNLVLQEDIVVPPIILPLAISFFTFQQVAYLVDSFKGITIERDPLNYSLFITFFPQLIAGPIVHHKEMLPQFCSGKTGISANNLAIGMSIFSIGLFKKTVIADGIAPYANQVFSLAESGQNLDFFQAWGGALAYTFQLYFDFSGYSDMAIGLARIFGIVLPLNFYSPYKATNISEFWRRWHMTLSRFLKDYVYIPLGGNRLGEFKRLQNLFITMLLGGIWHGAGWNFAIWGALHGSYLVIYHQFHHLRMEWSSFIPSQLKSALAWMLTFLAVVVGWVFFRAQDLSTATNMLSAMTGAYGAEIPNAIIGRIYGVEQILNFVGITASPGSGSFFVEVWLWNIILLFAVLTLPNIQDMFSKVNGSLSSLSAERQNSVWLLYQRGSTLVWHASKPWALTTAICLALGILTLSQISEFLYFQF